MDRIKRPMAVSVLPEVAILFLAFLMTPSWGTHNITDCGGTYISFSGQSNSNDVTEVPGGSIVLSVTATNIETVPLGVTLMKLIKRDSDGAIIPCLDGISGSCQMDLCDFIVNYPHVITIPSVTDCPIPSATHNFNVILSFNELWLPINGDMQNITYKMRYELKDDLEIVGCFEFPFSLSTVVTFKIND